MAYRPRRQLVARIHDDSGSLVLRFLNFYPSHQKALARGVRIRARGDVRSGFFGREMVHPSFKAVEAGTPLSSALTPVYPTARNCRRPICARPSPRRCSARRSPKCCRPTCVPAGLPSLRDALAASCTTRRPTRTLAALLETTATRRGSA